jgi:formate hydrogenlyase subunit 3/multisubunit Na+/H+ antiporter MnhD subunit
VTPAIDALVVVALALPIAVAAAICVRTLRPVALRVAPWAALPAFVAAFGGAKTSVHADSILLGTSIGVEDVVTRAFLVLTATVWLASGLFARAYMADDPRRARFWLYFLVTATGNIGLVLAQDVASFYLFYALMTFAAYGLVVHVQTDEARRAGKVYLAMGLLGEVLLLAAFVMLVGVEVNLPLREAPRAVASSPDRALVVGLLLAGFGIKAGALVLHVWLPLAHPVAPTPASAVLSGAMIKAGLLGWLRFLPLGIVALPDAGRICIVGGFAAAFYAVVVGLGQRDLKTILAYSSVSQMGFMTAALGIALVVPASATMAISALLFYALHHALAKAALFLGTGVTSATRPGWPHRLAVVGMLLCALDLAGAPLSSGSLAKISLKHLVSDQGAALGMLLSAGAVGSTLLMAKLLALVIGRREPAAPRSGLWAPWLLLIVLDVVLLVWPPIDREQLALLVDPANMTSAAWPVIAGTAIAVAARRALKIRGARRGPRIPPGDLLAIFELAHHELRDLLASVVLAAQRVEARLRAWASRRCSVEQRWEAMVRRATRLERSFSTFTLIGAALVLLGISLAWVYR